MRNPIKRLSGIRRVEQSVGIYDYMIRVGEKRKVDFTFPILSDFLCEKAALLVAVYADGIQFDGLVFP